MNYQVVIGDKVCEYARHWDSLLSAKVINSIVFSAWMFSALDFWIPY